jgi:hypothetical protein
MGFVSESDYASGMVLFLENTNRLPLASGVTKRMQDVLAEFFGKRKQLSCILR